MNAAWPLLALALSAPAAAQETRTFHLIHTQGLNFTESIDLIDALERLISTDPAHVVLEKIDAEAAYYSPGQFLYGAGKTLPRAKLPPPAPAPTPLSRAPFLETPLAVLFASEVPAYPLFERLLALAQDPNDERAYAAGVALSSGVAELRPDGFKVFHCSDASPGSRWSLTFASHYHLRIDGKPVIVTLIGKPIGGVGRLVTALKRRLSEIHEPAFQLITGNISIEDILGAAPDAALKPLADHGFRLLAFDGEDLEEAWDVMVRYSSRTALLCSNLKAIQAEAPLPFERVHVEELAGVRVGFLSLIPVSAKAALARRKLPFEIEDPVAAAKAAIRELRTERKADLIVAVSHLRPDGELRLMREVEGMDLLLDSAEFCFGSEKTTTVELRNWRRDRHGWPILRALPPRNSFDELAVTYRDSPRGPELEKISEIPGPVSPDIPEDASGGDLSDKLMGFFLEPQEALLPDPRRVWPAKLGYEPVDFWNLAAQTLRQKSGAEISVLQVHRLNGDTTGDYPENIVREWLYPPLHPVAARLPGSALKALLPRFAFAEPPGGGPPRNYNDRVWLIGAGIDSKGLVNRVPVSDGEFYEIATTQELLDRSDELPELKGAANPRALPGTLTDMVVASLKEKAGYIGNDENPRAARLYEEELRERMEGKVPEGLVWRINLRDLSVMFSNTQIQAGDAFAQVRDSRIQATSQLFTQESGKLFSELYWGDLRWDAGVNADFAKSTIKPKGSPPVVNVANDSLVYETELRRRARLIERGAMKISLGPFVNVAYDTQFEKPNGLPKREIVRTKAGGKLFDGSHLKSLYLGPAAETDYSFPTPRTQWGYGAGFDWDSAIPGSKVYLKAKADYLDFFLGRRDTGADLRRKLDLTVKMKTPLWQDLNLSPFLNLYVFQAKIVPTTGYNVMFGVSLAYSKLWKPFY